MTKQITDSARPPTGPQLDFAAARSAGYSDADIAQFMAAQKGMDYNAATQAGHSPSEIITYFGGTPAPSGFVDHARQGVADVAGGIGETMHDYIGGGWGDTAKKVAEYVAPKDFTPARIVDDNGFHAGNIPAWMAERAPGLAAQLAAARLTGKMGFGKVGQVGAAAGLGTAMSAGNEADTAAAKRTGDPTATPNSDDLVRGGLTAGVENVIGALPVTRFMPATGPVAATGVKGAVQGLEKLATTAGAEGLSGAGQSVVGQVGQSVGTKDGVKVDPAQVFDSAAGSALTGATFASHRAAGDLLNARKYSMITPDLMPAATQFANRVQDAAGGRNLDAGIFTGGSAQETGGDAFTKATAGVHNELATAVSDLNSRGTLPPEADNILKSTAGGRMPTDADYNTLKTALGTDPQAANILNLVQQAHAAKIVEGTGYLSGGKFTGGLAAHAGSALTGHNIAKTAMVGLGGAALEGGAGHLIAYSPEIMATLAGATVLARVADNVTGARAPAGRFVSNFADGTSPVRVAPQAPPPAQAAPAPAAPLNPPIGGPGQPWGRPPAGAGGIPLIPPRAAPVTPQAAPAPAMNPLTLPPAITKPANNIMSGQAWLEKLKSAHLGQEQANAAVQASPFIDQKVGGAENVPDPATAKAMKQAIGSANALAKLQSDPEAEAAQKAADKEAVAHDRAQAKAAANTARANALSTVQATKLAAKVAAAQAAPPPLPNVTKVTKVEGKVKVGTDAPDSYAVPFSPHAAHPPEVAAQKFLQGIKDSGGSVAHENGFLRGTATNIRNIRNAATDVAARTQGVSAQAIAGQFEGVQTQAAAIAHREWLKKVMPQAAPQLDHYFSDAVIKGTPTKRGIWTH